MKKIRTLSSALVVTMAISGGAMAAGGGEATAKLDGYQGQLQAIFQWSRQKDTDIPAPVSVGDIESAVKHFLADPSADDAFEAMQFVYMAAGMLKGESAKLAQSKCSQIESNILKHHINNPKLFGFLLGASRSGLSLSFIERVFDAEERLPVKAQIADLILDQVASQLMDSTLSSSKRAALQKKGIHYGELYMEKLADSVPNMDIGGKNIPLNKWRVVGDLNDIRYHNIGQKLPNWQFKDLEGKKDGTARFAGKVMLIDFWTTWCGPCKASLPAIAEMTEQLADTPFQMISIACDQEVEPVIEFREDEQPMPWVNWHSPSLTREGELLGVRAFPTYYVVDAEGVIRMKTHSFKEAEPLVRKLAEQARNNVKGVPDLFRCTSRYLFYAY